MFGSFVSERGPLHERRRLLGEVRSERDRRHVDRCLAVGERGGDRLRQQRAVEGELIREEPDVVEVLHAAVQPAQVDHRLELLGHHRLARVARELGRREAEQRGVRDGLRTGSDDVAEPDVDLHGDARPAEQTDEANPHALVVRVLLDALGFHCGRVEHHAVWLDIGRAHLTDHAFQVLERVVEAAEEVEVLRRARERRVPHVQHQRALEDQARPVRRLRQPVEEPLHRVVLQQLLEGPLRRTRVILETRLHGGFEVLDGHGIASR
ncbi:MAG TPA: hypothetical protein VF516_42230 [Kofleriaceae bacterium]